MPDLRELNIYSILLRVFLAVIMGGALGIERERKNRPAGFRTHMLVCVGAALVMMTNQYAFQYFAVSDPVRMGAQVVSGIGFLGAGTIMVTGKNQIKGITTAAGLWTAACCGLAVGIGFYEGAVAGSITVLLVMVGLRHLDKHIRRNLKTVELYIELDTHTPFSKFVDYTRIHDIEIFDVQMEKNKMDKDSALSVLLSVNNKQRLSHNELIQILSDAPSVHYIEAL